MTQLLFLKKKLLSVGVNCLYCKLLTEIHASNNLALIKPTHCNPIFSSNITLSTGFFHEWFGAILQVTKNLN